MLNERISNAKWRVLTRPIGADSRGVDSVKQPRGYCLVTVHLAFYQLSIYMLSRLCILPAKAIGWIPSLGSSSGLSYPQGNGPRASIGHRICSLHETSNWSWIDCSSNRGQLSTHQRSDTL